MSNFTTSDVRHGDIFTFADGCQGVAVLDSTCEDISDVTIFAYPLRWYDDKDAYAENWGILKDEYNEDFSNPDGSGDYEGYFCDKIVAVHRRGVLMWELPPTNYLPKVTSGMYVKLRGYENLRGVLLVSMADHGKNLRGVRNFGGCLAIGSTTGRRICDLSTICKVSGRYLHSDPSFRIFDIMEVWQDNGEGLVKIWEADDA